MAGRAGRRGRRGVGVGCVGMCGVCGWEAGGGGREEGEREGRGQLTDSIEHQNSHKQSLLSSLDQEHPLLGTPMPDFGRGILTDVTAFNCHFWKKKCSGSRAISDV